MDLLRFETDVEHHPRGRVIVQQGAPGDRMYVVREGEAEIRVGDRVVERVGPGGFFGEMSLVDHGPRSASVVALTDVTVVPIDERRFQRMVQQTPGFAVHVFRELVRRLREADRRL